MNVSLSEVLSDYGFAYLLTLGDDSRPHVSTVSPVCVSGVLRVDGLGRHALANVGVRPLVTLVWPPLVAGGRSLIVDGTALSSGSSISVSVSRAVLHRPVPGPAPVVDGCVADCLEVVVPR